MIDRIYIDKKINEEVIPLIDERDFLGLSLSKSATERTDLFIFALALGINEGKRTPLTTKHGFILDSSIENNDIALSLIYSVLVEEMRNENTEEKISDKDTAYLVAQEYANTGFYVIKNWLDNNKTDEGTLWKLLSEMDEKYNKVFEH